jgi:hypothetical protein
MFARQHTYLLSGGMTGPADLARQGSPAQTRRAALRRIAPYRMRKARRTARRQ